MPAQKRSLAESLDDGETSQLYHHRHARRSLRDRQLKPEEQQEEEDDEQGEELEEQGGGGEEEAKGKAEGYFSAFSFLDYIFVCC